MKIKEKVEEIFKKITKNKLLFGSLIVYFALIIGTVSTVFANNKLRTDGEYVCYSNGTAISRIVLKRDNSVIIESYEGADLSHSEFKQKDTVDHWAYRSSDWYKNYDPEVYKYLSHEFVSFNSKNNDTRFIFFLVDNKLYSSYLIKDSGGEHQKCYVKI